MTKINVEQKMGLLLSVLGASTTKIILNELRIKKNKSESEIKNDKITFDEKQILKSIQSWDKATHQVILSCLKEFWEQLSEENELIFNHDNFIISNNFVEEHFSDQLILDRKQSISQILKKADDFSLNEFLRHQHPQIITTLILFLEIERRTQIFSKLPPSLMIEVIERLKNEFFLTPQTIKTLHEEIEKEFMGKNIKMQKTFGGVDSVSKMIAQLNPSEQKNILEKLKLRDPELEETIKSKLFTWENLFQLSKKQFIDLFTKTPFDWWVMTLKSPPPELMEHLKCQLPEKIINRLNEELEHSPPVKMSEVTKYQQLILQKARELYSVE
jgi:flagellar motor switch protein FliG